MKTERHKCGCVSKRHNGKEWWDSMCEPHKAETEETRARWKAWRDSRGVSTTLQGEET